MAQWMVRSEKVRRSQVNGFVEFCLEVLIGEQGRSIKEVSELSGLYPATIYRLRAGKFSSAIRFSTVQKLMAVTGCKLGMEEE